MLEQVRNDYDRETEDFHNWEYRCGREELSRIVAEKTGLDLGTIRELKALERGDSGRIVRIELVGDRGRAVIGKELAIRQALSRDCLKSSAFEDEWEGDTLVLHGRGWGHGVGLCQIGAAVMASEGYGFRQILAHYYTDSVITDISDNYAI